MDVMERTALYEGKAKIIYPGPDAETLVQFFKDVLGDVAVPVVLYPPLKTRGATHVYKSTGMLEKIGYVFHTFWYLIGIGFGS